MIKQSFKRCYDRVTTAIAQNKWFYLFALLAMLIAGLYAAFLSSRTLPFSEGWYTYYAKCIHSGQLPYRDFEYLYPPVYIYFMALVTKIFGYDLIVLRAMGVLFFALITLGLYLSVTVVVGKKRAWIALVAAITAAFYLQTEVVQIFYDYVRLMDIFVIFALYFLLKTVRGLLKGETKRSELIALGILLSLLTNAKQNTGLIFTVYALVLMVYTGLWQKKTRRRDAMKALIPLLIAYVSVFAVVFLALWCSGSLPGFLAMTGLSAAGAKGGLQAILLGWIIHNKAAFLASIPLAVFSVLLIVGIYLLRRFYLARTAEAPGIDSKKELCPYLALAFALLMFAGLLTLKLSQAFAQWLAPVSYWSPYAIFLTVTPLFLICGVWGLVDILRKKQSMAELFLPFALAGAYFAIAFACGNSGGIAEGQSGFGVALIVTCVLLFLDFAHIQLLRVGAVILCLLVSLQGSGKKMLDTYIWWGMNESNYWSSTETMDHELLRGIKLSPETKAVYENIYREVTENTSSEDSIFCFPHVPIFYALCDRNDPGTSTKVQWFDVTSDQAVLADIEVLQSNPPKAIILYNSSDGAYDGHENAFRGGAESGTRAMREALYNLVSDQGYRFCGRYVANSNSISLWIADDSPETPAVNFAGGSGTEEDPYLVSTPEQFQYLSDMVAAGRSFHKQFIRQTCDLDMTGWDYAPLDSEQNGAKFAGTYDDGGFALIDANAESDEPLADPQA